MTSCTKPEVRRFVTAVDAMAATHPRDPNVIGYRWLISSLVALNKGVWPLLPRGTVVVVRQL